MLLIINYFASTLAICIIAQSKHCTKNKKLQSDRMTRYVSKLVLCFTIYGSFKGFKQRK